MKLGEVTNPINGRTENLMSPKSWMSTVGGAFMLVIALLLGLFGALWVAGKTGVSNKLDPVLQTGLTALSPAAAIAASKGVNDVASWPTLM